MVLSCVHRLIYILSKRLLFLLGLGVVYLEPYIVCDSDVGPIRGINLKLDMDEQFGLENASLGG